MTEYPLNRECVRTVAKQGNGGGMAQAVRCYLKPYLLTVHLDTP